MALPFGWIDTKNRQQLKWVSDYLARKRLAEPTLFQSIKGHAATDYQEMAERLKALPDDAVYREQSRRMKGAWQTRNSRNKNGKQVSFQLSQNTLKQLNNVALKRGLSKVETLRQIISNACNDQNTAKAQLREEQEKYSAQLKKQQETHQQSERVYEDAVNGLIDALAIQLCERCRHELNLGGCDETPTDSETVRKEYLALVEKRASELPSELSHLLDQRNKDGPSLLERVRSKAKVYSLQGLTVNKYKGLL